jgi:adenylate cyclase
MQRKLTAILSADVVGYSGLMEADEVGTLERLKANRARIFDPHVSIHGGRVFKLIGDGALVEFPSVISAVECALAIQDATEKTDGNEVRRIRYRIGINLGEVIIEGDDIYGEGVNIAARIQSLAPVGGVALSQVVKDQIAGKASCTLEDLGEHTVKNIERPVRVYCARIGAPTPETRTAEASKKPTICVLPFANMSGEVEQEYFSDGISEDIITDLSKVSALDVIARNTSFQFKGKNVDTSQVARQLKVSHILEGSVRKAGGRVRITAQLIDGASGSHLWAERYDRDLNDIFALQDEISEAIVSVLKVKLVPEEKKAIEQRGTDNVEAYDLYLMARREYEVARSGNISRFRNIRRLCERITQLDPDFPRGWTLLATAKQALAITGLETGETDRGLAAAERALVLDPKLADAHAVKAKILMGTGHLDEASHEIDVALSLDPNSEYVALYGGDIRVQQRRFKEAIEFFEKAMTLNEAEVSAPFMLITCYRAVGDSEGARRAAERTLERVEKRLTADPNDVFTMAQGSAALSILGQVERAKEWMRRAALVEPDNLLMRYNFACTLSTSMNDIDAAIEMIRPVFTDPNGAYLINAAKVDSDFDPLRDNPRFQELMAAFDERTAG